MNITPQKHTSDNAQQSKANPVNFISGYFSLLLFALFGTSFIANMFASKTNSTFLDAERFKFSKTPDELTLGEQLTHIISFLSVILLAIGFLLIFLLGRSKPIFAPIALMTATFVCVVGITAFSCLNTYSIIEIFNTLSNSVKYIGPSMKSYYTNLLWILISYQIILPVFAGTLVRFSMSIKNTLTTDRIDFGGAFAFTIASLLLAFWHVLSLSLSSRLMDEYFNSTHIAPKGYYLSETAAILCALAFGLFAFIYYLKCIKFTKADKKLSE